MSFGDVIWNHYLASALNSIIMTLTLVAVIILIILTILLGLGVFGAIPMTQNGINRLTFVLLATLVLAYSLGKYL